MISHLFAPKAKITINSTLEGIEGTASRAVSVHVYCSDHLRGNPGTSIGVKPI